MCCFAIMLREVTLPKAMRADMFNVLIGFFSIWFQLISKNEGI